MFPPRSFISFILDYWIITSGSESDLSSSIWVTLISFPVVNHFWISEHQRSIWLSETIKLWTQVVTADKGWWFRHTHTQTDTDRQTHVHTQTRAYEVLPLLSFFNEHIWEIHFIFPDDVKDKSCLLLWSVKHVVTGICYSTVPFILRCF